ncbi:hypothetical protein AAVH_20463 [Aphelenchoides avenae]|nr:hypothetical protein AAVH_20463 [Aphelenchus avenae]
MQEPILFEMSTTTTSSHWTMEGWKEAFAFPIVLLVVHVFNNSFTDVWARLEVSVLRLPEHALKILLIGFMSVSVVAPFSVAMFVNLPWIITDVVRKTLTSGRGHHLTQC